MLFKRQLRRARAIWEEDLAERRNRVSLPFALPRKYPNAQLEWAWKYVFPASRYSKERRTGRLYRHHAYPSSLEEALKKADRTANIAKNVTCHTFRHSFATHLLEDGVPGAFESAAFMTTGRTNEIGVRKLLSASIPNLLFLLSKDFAKLVLMAALVALPLAVVVTSRWLDTFAYRTKHEPLIFLKAVGLAIVVAVVSVSCQTMRASLANPVSNLRQE